MTLGRRQILRGLVACVACDTLARRAGAEEVSVPVSRQAELLVRVAAYDRNLPTRANGVVRALILTNPDDADSRAVAAQMDAALRRFDRIAGLPCEIGTAPLESGPKVAAACAKERLSIVYVTQSLDAKIAGLVEALTGVDVLSACAIPRYVSQGIVLGFDLVSSKPTLLIHLTQAKRQNVAIDAGVLNLMKVVG